MHPITPGICMFIFKFIRLDARKIFVFIFKLLVLDHSVLHV